MCSFISEENQLLLTRDNTSFGCICRNTSNWPLEEKCPTPKVIYQTDVTNDTSFTKSLGTIPNRLIINDTKIKQNCRNTYGHYSMEIKCQQLSGK